MTSSQNSIAIEDYNRAVSYMWDNVNNKKAFNLYIRPHWFSDSSGLWYVNQSVDNKQYLKIALPDLEKSDLFDHQKLAAALTDSLGEDIKSNNLPLTKVEYKNFKELLITVKDKQYILNTVTQTLSTPELEVEANEN